MHVCIHTVLQYIQIILYRFISSKHYHLRAFAACALRFYQTYIHTYIHTLVGFIYFMLMSSLLLPSAKLISCVLHLPTHNNLFVSSRSVSTLISLRKSKTYILIATQPSVKSSLQPVSVSVSVLYIYLFCIPTWPTLTQVGNALSTVTLLWQMPS